MPGAPAAGFPVQRIRRAIFRDPCPVASNPLAPSNGVPCTTDTCCIQGKVCSITRVQGLNSRFAPCLPGLWFALVVRKKLTRKRAVSEFWMQTPNFELPSPDGGGFSLVRRHVALRFSGDPRCGPINLERRDSELRERKRRPAQVEHPDADQLGSSGKRKRDGNRDFYHRCGVQRFRSGSAICARARRERVSDGQFSTECGEERKRSVVNHD